MEKKDVILICFAALFVVIGACTVTIQVQRDNTNSSFENSSTTSNSADSADVQLDLR